MALGALRGLEPGHSKTLMAAFIVAIRGTVRQAVLLGVSATLSHTAVIWILALIGLYYSGQFDAERTEPYFQIAMGVIVIGMALWMFARTRREVKAAERYHHGHGHQHLDEHEGHEHDSTPEYEGDHEREHAEEIEKRLANRQVTTGQLILFGLTGGLPPCPAAFTVALAPIHEGRSVESSAGQTNPEAGNPRCRPEDVVAGNNGKTDSSTRLQCSWITRGMKTSPESSQWNQKPLPTESTQLSTGHAVRRFSMATRRHSLISFPATSQHHLGELSQRRHRSGRWSGACGLVVHSTNGRRRLPGGGSVYDGGGAGGSRPCCMTVARGCQSGLDLIP